MTKTTAAAGAMLPGTYIEKRREAAGLEMIDVALMLVEGELTIDKVGILLVQVETDDTADIAGHRLHEFLGHLRRAFSFDRDVYLALAGVASGQGTPIPPICRVCACSWDDPCSDDRGKCAWANAGSVEAPLCTFCRDKPPAAANDAEVRHAA